MGYFAENQPDFTALNALVDLYEAMGQPIPPKYPLYGRDAHRTRAGIHADGLNKFWWMYAPFNVPDLLGRPLEVSLTKDSGIAGLVFLVRQHLGVDLPKDDAGLQAVYQWIVSEFDNGRQTSIEWEEIEGMVREKIAVSHQPSAVS
jgi:2-phosphinomethylmalic acid synthase